MFWIAALIITPLATMAQTNFNVTFDDTDPSVSYSSSPGWDTLVWAQQLPQPLEGTNHGTPNPGAKATFRFTGNAVYVYGYKNTDHGLRTFTIDSGRVVQCDGRNGQLGSRALLFSTSSLNEGEHTLEIEHTGENPQYLNIDYFFVSTLEKTTLSLSSVVGSPSSATGSPPSDTRFPSVSESSPASESTPSSSLNVGVISGAAAGGATLILLVIITIWFFRCKKNRVRLAVDLDGGGVPMVAREEHYRFGSMPSQQHTRGVMDRQSLIPTESNKDLHKTYDSHSSYPYVTVGSAAFSTSQPDQHPHHQYSDQPREPQHYLQHPHSNSAPTTPLTGLLPTQASQISSRMLSASGTVSPHPTSSSQPPNKTATHHRPVSDGKSWSAGESSAGLHAGVGAPAHGPLPGLVGASPEDQSYPPPAYTDRTT